MSEKVVVCFSGGKDSTAMLLRMIELNEKIDYIVFGDTTFEYPELYEYIKRIEKIIGRKIEILKPKKSFNEWFFGKLTRGKSEGRTRGFPYILGSCYWMRESKYNPITRFIKGKKVIRCIGIASDEQNRVQKSQDIRYPLIEWNWTEQDCVNYLNKRKLLNPLYQNFKRLGCFICPKQSDYAKWITWKQYPKLWEKIKFYEEQNLKLCNRNIFSKPIKKYEKEWEKGIKPKIPQSYECFECKGVKKIIFDCNLDNWIKRDTLNTSKEKSE